VTTNGPEDDDSDLEALTPEEEQAISALLAALPSEPMPPEVLARIEAALAAEPPLSGTAVIVPNLDLERVRRRRRNGQLLFRVAASVVGLAGAIALGITIANGGGSSSSAGTTAAGAASTSTGTVPEAGQPATSSAASAATPASRAFVLRITRSGRTYDKTNLAAAAAQLVKGEEPVPIPKSPPSLATGGLTQSATPTPSSAAPTGTSTSSAAAASATRSPAALGFSAYDLATKQPRLDACVRELTLGDGRKPLAVDVGEWDQQQVLVVVLPSPTEAKSADLEAYVVTPQCGSTSNRDMSAGNPNDVLQVAFFTP
jgi:hypothetical protein